MKWYERQKQMYAQKNQPETPAQPQENEIAQEEQEPIHAQATYDDMQTDQNTYNNTFDEMLNDPYDQSTDTYHEPTYQDAMFAQHQNDHATTIAKNTIINGNIEADGDLIIRGHVKGDVLCNANLSIYGIVEGTINCNNAYLDEAMVIGDIGCSGNMQVSDSSTINGNVEAYELLNGGRIKGNATIAEGIRFLATSAIVGNINANDIQVERGAVIQGNVTIRQEVYFNEN